MGSLLGFTPASAAQQAAVTAGVTLTVAQLRAAVRYGSSTDETTELTRILAYATEAIQRHAPDAPEATANEAAVRLSAYILDQPNTGRGDGFANAMRNSGAARMLLPYRVHTAGVVENG